MSCSLFPTKGARMARCFEMMLVAEFILYMLMVCLTQELPIVLQAQRLSFFGPQPETACVYQLTRF